MMKIIKILLIIGISLVFCSDLAMAQSNPKSWQEAKSINGSFKAVSSQPEIEVFSAPNVIMIKVNHETEVRIFTILGKLISSQLLKPGIYEYRLDSHGV